MKKENIRAAMVFAVLLVLYNLIVFLVPFNRTNVFWISYGFTIAAFVIASIAIYIGFIKQPDAKSKFYGFPILKIGVVYTAVQIIAGLIFMLLGTYIPSWIPSILYAVIAGATVIGLVSADTVVEQIQVQDAKLKKDIFCMRELQSIACSLPGLCNNMDTKKKLENLADNMRYSDPISSKATSEAEAELKICIAELQRAVVENDLPGVAQLCIRAEALLKERNRLCKLNK